MVMQAFLGDATVRDKYLGRVRAHELADEIIHGKYWEGGKGCAVGCTIHSSAHVNFEAELGIPRMLARLEDTIFEGQKNGDAKTFPRRFLESITVGADLSRVPWLFLHWLLTEELAGRDDPRVAKQIKACVDVLVPLTKGEPVDREAAIKARREARAAYAAAYAANADAAADAAYAAYANAAAADAAYAAYANAAAAADAYADDADDAADAAAAAYANADAAAYAAYAAYAAAAADADAYADDAARATSYKRMADKLLELMAQAPVVPFFARAA